MSGSLRWSGLDELRAALRDLPNDLTAEASGIVQSSANEAAEDIREGYRGHRRSGNLEGGVVVTRVDAGKHSAGAIVKNKAKHAALFENGTQARHTAIGANRGSMPPAHVFVPRVIRHRRAMYDRLKGLLERHGLKVGGDV